MVEIKIVKSKYEENIKRAMKELDKKVSKVGWFEKSKYPPKKIIVNGKHVGHYLPMQVAQVAYLNEKGKYARPFIRPTIVSNESNWRKIAFNKSKQIINGKSTAYDLMETVGLKASSDISKKIKQIWTPPLKPSTIKARINRYTNDSELSESTRKRRKSKLKNLTPSGLYKPLIDTGLMLATLINVVEDE